MSILRSEIEIRNILNKVSKNQKIYYFPIPYFLQNPGYPSPLKNHRYFNKPCLSMYDLSGFEVLWVMRLLC